MHLKRSIWLAALLSFACAEHHWENVRRPDASWAEDRYRCDRETTLPEPSPPPAPPVVVVINPDGTTSVPLLPAPQPPRGKTLNQTIREHSNWEACMSAAGWLWSSGPPTPKRWVNEANRQANRDADLLECRKDSASDEGLCMRARGWRLITEVPISLTSTPNGGEIYMDGRFIALSPSTGAVIPGPHDIEVRKPGFSTWSRHIVAEVGAPIRLTAELQLKPE